MAHINKRNADKEIGELGDKENKRISLQIRTSHLPIAYISYLPKSLIPHLPNDLLMFLHPVIKSPPADQALI